MEKAIFVDRDGTLNFDSSYINKPEDFDLYYFAGKAIKNFRQKGFLVIIISNQSGVGRGIISEQNLKKINNKMKEQLSIFSTKIDDIYYCPYYAEAKQKKYRQNPENRKPDCGMILSAAKKYNIDLTKSYMIGDRISDIQAGIKAGCKTVLVLSGDGKNHLNKINEIGIKPDYIVENLYEFSKLLISF